MAATMCLPIERIPDDIVCIDGEDPHRSSLTELQLRSKSAPKNVSYASPGEELTFNYSDETLWMALGKWTAVVLGAGGLIGHFLFGLNIKSPLLG